ncbi:hypothetical protein [Teredinibacter sp. KSP-S5-2]|uniref:hypothetical protein n=1 Tax=Teredinibacter sp. KSP-S5-2 TaxID=3034506 RepID=UPI0029353207|nr:hypothetical protein [Teredinibacter sp. KSP-S5-2]WNO07942.1 hypothetical protein P5V12_13240 [Teredinibacter sp. KSP-S5-2]
MKQIFLLVGILLFSFESHAECDLDSADLAIGEYDAMYSGYRDLLSRISNYDEELFYKRKTFIALFETPEGMVKSMRVHGVVIEIGARSTLMLMQDCQHNVDQFRTEVEQYEQDSKSLSDSLATIYQQCHKTGKKDFRKTITQYYKKRDWYKSNVEHLNVERIAPIERQCLAEKEFVERALELSGKD